VSYGSRGFCGAQERVDTTKNGQKRMKMVENR
jgi:hypothetical protein